MEEEDHNALIEKVTTGFGALLGQVQELAAKNDALEQKLSHVRGEVRSSPSYSNFSAWDSMMSIIALDQKLPCSYDRLNKSRT